MTPGQLDATLVRLAQMDRKELIRFIRQIRCSFELDFSDDFLHSMSLERLRHVTVAALLHANGVAS